MAVAMLVASVAFFVWETFQGRPNRGFAVAYCGLVAALSLAGRVSPLLYEVSAKDPVTYAGVVGVLLVVAVVASLAPALRAARVDPNVALRAD